MEATLTPNRPVMSPTWAQISLVWERVTTQSTQVCLLTWVFLLVPSGLDVHLVATASWPGLLELFPGHLVLLLILGPQCSVSSHLPQ